jgi:hypothetical protein
MQNSIKNIFLSSLMVASFFSMPIHSSGLLPSNLPPASCWMYLKKFCAERANSVRGLLEKGLSSAGSSWAPAKQKIQELGKPAVEFLKTARGQEVAFAVGYCAFCTAVFILFKKLIDRDIAKHKALVAQAQVHSEVEVFAQEINTFCEGLNLFKGLNPRDFVDVPSFLLNVPKIEQSFLESVKLYQKKNHPLSFIAAIGEFGGEMYDLLSRNRDVYEKYKNQVDALNNTYSAYVFQAFKNYDVLQKYEEMMFFAVIEPDLYVSFRACKKLVKIFDEKHTNFDQKILICLFLMHDALIGFGSDFDIVEAKERPCSYIVDFFNEIIEYSNLEMPNYFWLKFVSKLSVLLPQVKELMILIKQSPQYQKETAKNSFRA